MSAGGGAPVRQRAAIGLGANLGDARATLRAATDALAQLPDSRLIAVSSHFRSAPVDAAGPDYINAVALLDTALAPLALLAALQAIEQHHGRERPYHHAPRTLDLDLLLFGDESIDLPSLQVPHPRGHRRAFVLAPLVEVAPGLAWPGQAPIEWLLAALADQPVERLA